MNNVYAPDFSSDKSGLLRALKFGSPEMERFVRETMHKLYVFDPVQGFIPPSLNMGSRNAMRDCLAPLISLGEETGASFLIIAHTNKRKGASGRDRVADSADLWDISRSVLMAGYTEEQGIRYLSNEKNNYSRLQETLLFSIDEDGQITEEGRSWKRDREFQQETLMGISAPKREDCKNWLLTQLETRGGKMPSAELDDAAKAAGFTRKTVRNAKDALKENGMLQYRQTFADGKKQWYTELLQSPDEEPLPL